MRCIIKTIKVLDKKEHEKILKLKNEKGIFSIGKAFFHSGDSIIIACSFKPFDTVIPEQDFHAVNVKKQNNKISFSTAYGNFITLELLS